MPRTSQEDRQLKHFGEALAARRREAELTQEEVAHDTGLHVNYIGGLERGLRNPTVLTLLKLARTFRCSVGDLVDEAFMA